MFDRTLEDERQKADKAAHKEGVCSFVGYGRLERKEKCLHRGRDLSIACRPPTAGIGNYFGVEPMTYYIDAGVSWNDYSSDIGPRVAQYSTNYNATIGYQLAGMGWFQGWNDILERPKVKCTNPTF